MSKIARLLVATDLTERSERAFQRAIELKSQAGASVTLLHAVEPGLFPPIGEERYADAEDFLRNQVAALPEEKRAGIACDIQVGEPFTTIIDEAHRRNAELIVLGQPAKAGLKELFVGTTTERVVRYSDLPVLVVKAPVPGAYQRVLVAMDLSEGSIRRSKSPIGLPLRPFPHVACMVCPIVGLWHERRCRKGHRPREPADTRTRRQENQGVPVSIGSSRRSTAISS